jgi:hypothetical protein
VVDPVGVGDQRVGHPGQIQQPVPVGIVAGQAGNLQRQHDTDLTQPDLGGQFGESGPAGGRRAGDTLILVDDLDAAAWPAQTHRTAGQIILAGSRFPVAVHLGKRRLAHIDDCGAAQMRCGDLAVLTHRRPPRRRPPAVVAG